MKKIQCHEKDCTNHPPISGPSTEESENTPANTPCTLPRSRGAITSPTTDSASTKSPPPPRPWSARETMRKPIDCAIPHIADPVRNSATDTNTIRRRP